MDARPMTAADWPVVRDIYAEGIATGMATFETAPPGWPAWDASHTVEHRFVAVHDDALHLRHGFRVIGTRERIGQSDGVWRDVLLLERRSAVV